MEDALQHLRDKQTRNIMQQRVPGLGEASSLVLITDYLNLIKRIRLEIPTKPKG